jgi:hypothetical protein
MGGRDLGMDTRKKPKNNLRMALNVYHYQLMETGGWGHSLLGWECNCAREDVLCVRNIFELVYTKRGNSKKTCPVRLLNYLWDVHGFFNVGV